MGSREREGGGGGRESLRAYFRNYTSMHTLSLARGREAADVLNGGLVHADASSLGRSLGPDTWEAENPEEGPSESAVGTGSCRELKSRPKGGSEGALAGLGLWFPGLCPPPPTPVLLTWRGGLRHGGDQTFGRGAERASPLTRRVKTKVQSGSSREGCALTGFEASEQRAAAQRPWLPKAEKGAFLWANDYRQNQKSASVFQCSLDMKEGFKIQTGPSGAGRPL